MDELCFQLLDHMGAACADDQADTTVMKTPDDIATFDAAVPIMIKANQCTLDETVVAWNCGGEWLAFKKVEDATGTYVKVKWCASKPKWFVTPPPAVRERLVPIMVPEHLVNAMRLHLGQLANSKEGVEA
jgi:hypothetical protein